MGSAGHDQAASGMGARLNVPDRATFFGGGGAGYTDYPFLTAAERGAP